MDPFTREEREEMADRLLLFIFPNTPKTREERRAFEKAITYQLRHEKDMTYPKGVSSFTIGHFTMRMEENGQTDRLTRSTISAAAYACLLRAGLLYKGIG